MSRSRCLLLLGTGSHYHGDGVAVDALMQFFEDKGVWRYTPLWNDYGRYPRWFSTPEHMFDDALLMTGLYLIGGLSDSAFPELVAMAKASFAVDPFNRSDRAIEPSSRKHIAPSAIERLYARNRELLLDTNTKIVAVFLGSNSVRIGGMNTDKNELLRAVEMYRLRNVEVCESRFARYFGAFDGDSER